MSRQTHEARGEVIFARWKRTRPRSPIEARRRLTELAKSMPTAAAAAVEAYLAGYADTLDEAFGLTIRAAKGRPRLPKTEAKMRKVFALRANGRSWRNVVDEIGGDERLLRRTYEQWQGRLLIEAMDHDWPPPKPKKRYGL